MLNLEVAKEKIQQTAMLITGRAVNKEYGTLIYDRIRDQFVMADPDKALAAMEGASDPRFSFPILQRELYKFRSTRMEAERSIEKAKDRAAIDNLPKTNPELSAMLDAILTRDKEALMKYELDRPYPVSNAVVITKSGRHEKAIIDHNQPGFMDHVTVVHVQAGEGTARELHLDTQAVGAVFIDDRYVAPMSGWKETTVEEWPEDDGWGH